MEKHKCIIYCRVSSERQVTEGHGLDSQEHRCKEYAKSKGYEIKGVFRDEGVSGGVADRPALNNLFEYLDTKPNEQVIVIIDDLSRLDRDLKVHTIIRGALKEKGAKLECLNMQLNDDDEVSEAMESIAVVFNQLHRKTNRKQVINRQKARLESGYWSFNPPLGLIHQKDALHGKLLVSNEPYASIFKKAIEAFANGELLTIEEVKHRINNDFQLHGMNKKLSFNGARIILTQILYAGWIEYKPWGVSARKGHHEGFITIETYQKVQERLKTNKKFGIRKDYNPDFPLRRMVECSVCHGAITGSWNRGRNNWYPNYFCIKKGCPMRYKTIHKSKIEPEFEEFLKYMKPRDVVLDLAQAVLKEVWQDRKAFSNILEEKNHKQLSELDERISNLKIRLSKTTNEELIMMYEEELGNLLNEKKSLGSKNFSNFSDLEFGTATDTVFTALKSPVDMWKSDMKEDKRTIFSMYFAKRLPYDVKIGFGTAIFDPTIGIIEAYDGTKTHLVETEGIEPSSVKVF